MRWLHGYRQALITKPDELSSGPRIHAVEGENLPTPTGLFFDLHFYAVTWVYTHTYPNTHTQTHALINEA